MRSLVTEDGARLSLREISALLIPASYISLAALHLAELTHPPLARLVSLFWVTEYCSQTRWMMASISTCSRPLLLVRLLLSTRALTAPNANSLLPRTAPIKSYWR